MVVGSEHAGARVDAALAALLPPLSRTYFGGLCKEGRVKIDGVVATKKSVKLLPKSRLHVRLRVAQVWVGIRHARTNVINDTHVTGGATGTAHTWSATCLGVALSIASRSARDRER